MKLAPQGHERGLVRAPQGLELERRKKSEVKRRGVVLQEQNTG